MYLNSNYFFINYLSWSILFYHFIIEAKSLQIDNRRLWNRIQPTLYIFQTIQLVEVYHCVIGLVPSSPVVTFQQIFTKLMIIWGIACPFSTPKESFGILMVTGCWSIAEITRYLYYSLNILNAVPYVLTWCRYSFFIILYPFGVMGELLIIYSSLNEIASNPKLSYTLPNFLNVSFYLHFLLIFIMFLYIPCKYF